jgi:signal peptidase
MTDDDTPEEGRSLVRRIPWRRLVNVVGLVLLLAVVVPFVIYAVPQVVGAEHSYVVLSGSMQPTMGPGDVVVVNDVPAPEIEQGDVITYAESGDGQPTTHRVIEVVEQRGETAFRTQGDNNPNPDQSLVTAAELDGRVMSVGGYLFVIPLIGYVIQFSSTPLGLVALLILPLGALVVSEIWDVITTASGGSSANAAAAEDGENGSNASKADEANGETASAETNGSGTAVIEAEAGGKPGGTGSDTGTTDTGTADGDASTNTADDEEEGLVFSAGELQLGLVVLVAFFAYSLWVAYATFFEVWAFAAAASVGAALLLLAGLYVVGGEAETAAQESQEEEQTATEDGTSPVTGDGESVFAANDEEASAEAAAEVTEATTAGTDADATREGSAVDINELLSLEEASEGGSQDAALKLSSTEKDGDGDGRLVDTAGESEAEVGDDD